MERKKKKEIDLPTMQMLRDAQLNTLDKILDFAASLMLEMGKAGSYDDEAFMEDINMWYEFLAQEYGLELRVIAYIEVLNKALELRKKIES
jgi:hypothetical protein